MKLFAQFISFIFHPLYIVSYFLLFFIYLDPYSFGSNVIVDHVPFILMVFFQTFLIPAFSIFLMQKLRFVESVEMKNKVERVIPYILSGIWYAWIFQNIHSSNQVPKVFTAFVLGATIALFVLFFINIFSKVSAHMAGVGGLLTGLIGLVFYFKYTEIEITANWVVDMIWVVAIATVIVGLVATSRLYLNAHTPRDIYRGFLIGILGQLLALNILF